MFYQDGYYLLENGQFLEVHECDDGYDFTIYNKNFDEVDGGVLMSQEWLTESYVVREVLALLVMESIAYEPVENFWI